MKLYYTPGTCALSDHIALEWIGKPFDAQLVTREQRTQPEYLEINPAGAVPALELTDGKVLLQNVAILNYLADSFPEAQLGGDGTPESRAEVNQWLSLVNSDVHPQFHSFFGKYDFLGDAKAIERTQDKSRENLRKLYERIDAQLDGKQWLAGERSIADPYLFVTLRWAKAQDVDLSGLDNLHAHYDRMRNDPGVRRAMETQGLA